MQIRTMLRTMKREETLLQATIHDENVSGKALTATDQSLLERAAEAYEENKPSVGDSYLQKFVGRYQNRLTASVGKGKGKIDPQLLEILVRRNPEQIRKRLVGFTFGLEILIEEVHKIEMKLAARTLRDSTFSPLRTKLVAQAVDQMHASLALLRAELRVADADEMTSFIRRKQLLLSLFAQELEDIIGRQKTVMDQALLIDRAIAYFPRTHKFTIDVGTYSEIERQRLSEQKLRIYVNRKSVGAVGAAVALIGEVGGMVFTAGATGAAIPATAATILGGMSTAGTAVGVGISINNLGDRVLSEGLKQSLTEVDTYLDLVHILSVIPLPDKSASKLIQGLNRLEDGIATIQMMNGIYTDLAEIIYATDIARKEADLKDGRTARDIRRNAVIDMASNVIQQGLGRMGGSKPSEE